MKHLEGKTVYLIPTGNLTRRYNYDENNLIEARVVKVARKFCTIVQLGRTYEEKLRFKGNSLSNECNGGYLVFESKQHLLDHKESIELSKEISNIVRYGVSIQDVPLDNLRKIKELLEGVEE